MNKNWDELYANAKHGDDPTCRTCEANKNERMAPSHYGSVRCESGSLNSGGSNSHCTCDVCF